MKWRAGHLQTRYWGTGIDNNSQGRDGPGLNWQESEFAPESEFAVAEVLGTLPLGALDAFRREQSETAIGARADCTVFDCDMRDGLPMPLKLSDRQHPLWQEIATVLERQGRFGAGVALKAHLALIAEGDDERPARIMVLGDDLIIRSLRRIMRQGEMTAAELRLLKQLVCGAGLVEAARADGVSHETKRTQFKSLSGKFDARSQGELTGRVISHLLMNSGQMRPSLAPSIGDRQTDNLFIALLDEFLPGARCHKLQGPGGIRHRFIDLGPADGRPVIFVHPQILPDFRLEDMAALSEAGLRLIVPLRHGAMSKAGPDLNVADHLDHACEGMDLARSYFFGGAQVHLLLCISGAAYGIEYARRHPERVASLAFAGAPASPVVAGSAAGRLRDGLFRLATSDGPLFSSVMDFYGRRITRPETFRRLLVHHYHPCPADLAVIEAEYAAPHGGERARKLFVASMRSVRQDFHHQARPRWHDLPIGAFPAAFFHGAKDFIHPIEALRALADELGGLPVHAIPDAGQLLYYRYFAPLLEAYHGFVAEAESR